MKNSEILKANLLDIIFENRNKDYGAYDLRKNYNNRLLIALGTGLFVILLFIFINSLHTDKKETTPIVNSKEGIVLRTIELPREMIKEPEKTKEVAKKKPVVKIATINYSTPPKIEKDKEVRHAMVAVKELDGKEISTETSDGKEADGKVVINKEPVEDPGTNTQNTVAQSHPLFVADERDPAFPGGQEALKQFLARNLNTPEDLQNGEKKVVKIKFQVDKDGSVTTFEIVTSGGNVFDREVVRVCKKMPRWTPALQNGINVPVNYILPVTFIGVEE